MIILLTDTYKYGAIRRRFLFFLIPYGLLVIGVALGL